MNLKNIQPLNKPGTGKRINFTETENILKTAAENSVKIKVNLNEAAKYDAKAARFMEEGKYEKAAHCAVLASEYLRLANEAKMEDIKLHATYN